MKTYVKFFSKFSTIVLRLQTAGQALPAFEQMKLFTNSTSHEPNIAKAIEKYVDNNPVLAVETLPQMIAAVSTGLSNKVRLFPHSMTCPMNLATKVKLGRIRPKRFDDHCDVVCDSEWCFCLLEHC